MSVRFVNRSDTSSKYLEEICTKFDVLESVVLSGWPHKFITLQNLQDMIAVYHELGIHRIIHGAIEDRRWYLSGQIVARIQFDNRNR